MACEKAHYTPYNTSETENDNQYENLNDVLTVTATQQSLFKKSEAQNTKWLTKSWKILLLTLLLIVAVNIVITAVLFFNMSMAHFNIKAGIKQKEMESNKTLASAIKQYELKWEKKLNSIVGYVNNPGQKFELLRKLQVTELKRKELYIQQRNISQSVTGYKWGPPVLRGKNKGRCGRLFSADCSATEIPADWGGVSPCCSPHNWCGISPEHCKCLHCFDFRIGTHSEIHLNNDGNTVTLVRAKINSGYTDNQAGMDKYVSVCRAIGAYPVGCGTSSHKCPTSWNGCFAMPSSWGCNMMGELHRHTKWNNIVALQDNPAKECHGYLYAYYTKSVNHPTGSQRLYAVCAKNA